MSRYALTVWYDGSCPLCRREIALMRRLDWRRRIDFIDMPESIRAKYQYHTQADITRLRAAGYEAPVTPLADAVRDYVQGYLVGDRRLGD